MPDQIAPDALETEEGRHATNLELFLDLVFVFAVTQVSGLFREDRTLPGFGRALLLTWLVWWLWSQFAWLGTGVELGPRSRAQYLVLVTVPLALLMAVGIPALTTRLGPRSLTPVKSEGFEGGNAPMGSARQRFAVKFYVVALLFIVFDVEAVFLYPWAVNFKALGWFGYGTMALFAATLVMALIYIWKKGALSWES